jgi:transposase
MPRTPLITSPYVPDLAELRAWLEKMVAAMRLIELVIAVIALVTRMRDINLELTKQLAQLRRKRPRSETLARLERQLQLPLSVAIAAKRKQKREQQTKRSRQGRHPGRAALPARLPRVREVNPVPPELRNCPICGSEMTTVGHSTCEILDVIPAQVIVRQRLDERVACPHDDAIVSAPTPPQLVERGKLGTALIVEATSDKYLEHLPIERQCTRWQRAGVDLAPQTLGRSVAKHIDLLEPLAKLIEQRTRAPGLLATDATTLPVLDRDAPDGIRTGTMWCWTNARWVTFFYSPQGDSDSVKRFLGSDLSRTVQCDGTSVTTFLERAGGKRPGCWAHGRRRLVEAARLGDTLALEALRMIADLFRVERESTAAGETAEQRHARRAEHSRPILEQLRGWVDEQRQVIPPKSPLGRALGYLHRQWQRLTLFLEDGNLELTNNRLERELRKLVLGKRNWLFTWEDLGGERTAHILTIIATAVAHNINPRAYLHVVTQLLVEGWPQSRLRDLLPDRILALHPELDTSRGPELATSADAPALPVPA